jgi:hypothetical protein
MSRNPRYAYDGEGTEVPPMTLGDMRAQGIRSIDAFCQAIGSGHEATIASDGLPDDLPVPDVGLRLRYSHCGGRAIHTRPNWAELKAADMGRDA